MADAIAGEKLACSIDEAQAALSIGRTTMFELLRTNEIVSVKVGRRRVIPTAELRAYLDRLVAAQGTRKTA